MGDRQPLVTVIIPSFNHAQYIDETIDSILAQEYLNWELIISDDGSNDNTHEVLEKYRGHDRIKLLLNAVNRGQGVVLNEAIDLSSGDFICLLASDDIYFPNKLRLQVARFAECDAAVGIVYTRGAMFRDGDREFVPDDRPIYTGEVFRQLLRSSFIHPISPMFRRRVFDFERFWPGFAAEGEAFYVRVARHFRAEFVPQITCAMRTHTYNTGRNVDLMYSENLRWLERFASTPDLTDDVRRLITRQIARLSRMKGLEYIRITKEYRKGVIALSRAIRDNPYYIIDWKVVAALAIATLFGWAKLLGLNRVGA